MEYRYHRHPSGVQEFTWWSILFLYYLTHLDKFVGCLVAIQKPLQESDDRLLTTPYLQLCCSPIPHQARK